MAKQKQELRPFQQKVRDLILAGENVILQAPTGAGKTRAALTPFVDNLGEQGMRLPLSCLYATPLRVLSTQFHQVYKELAEHIDKKKGTEYGRYYEKLLERAPISIQTGEQSNDPQFESLVTFCTIDQLLASFLGTPFGVGKRLANLNVGAVLGSYLVLDEFHLYPLVGNDESCFGARTTTLAMLSLLKGITPFVLMTATFSSTLLNRLAELLNAKIVTMGEEDLEELQAIAQGRRRFFEVADGEMSAEIILAQHDQCSLVLCNTVLRAQKMYWELKALADQKGCEVVLLHSRLTVQDRKERSEKIMRQLGPVPKQWEGDERYGWKDGHYYGKNLIVVSTQVVEVGLDISVQTLHTEIAPANSLIQRAGRCARYAQQEGHVIVYHLPRAEDGKQASTRPYGTKLCDATMTALRAMDLSQPLGFLKEQKLIDAVHTEEDIELLERLAKRQSEIEKAIFKNLSEHSSSVVSSLIRDVAQVQVVIHNDPNEAIKERPWAWQSFALHPGSLASHMKFFDEQRDALHVDWICKEARAQETEQDNEADNHQVTTYTWDTIPYSGNHHMMERKLREAIMVALPEALASYHEELGFILRDDWPGLPWPAYQSTPPEKKQGNGPNYGPIKQQSYLGHIGGLVDAYTTGIAEQVAYAARKLEQRLELPEESIDKGIRLAIACHDIGKLSEQWQQWAWEWQQLLYERKQWGAYQQQEDFFFAKTDYDSRDPDQRAWQHATKTKRPNHACESVALSRLLISNCLGINAADHKAFPLQRAICAAIARHHTPGAQEYNDVRLKSGSDEVVRQALVRAQKRQTWTYDMNKLKPAMKGSHLQPANGTSLITKVERGQLEELETWLYFVIVRALRLADQRADDFSR